MLYHGRMDANPHPRPRDGVNLYGYLTSNTGLGVAARNTVRMLQNNRVPFSLIDVLPGAGGVDDTCAELIAQNAISMPHHVNLFHLNPDKLRHMIVPFTSVDFERSPNVAVPFWEAPRLPRHWLKTLAAMDVILAPTLFIRDALMADLPGSTIVHYPQTVFLPDGVMADRERFGLPRDKIVFVASFALASDIERKNPWGVIDAFVRAFGDSGDAILALKVNNPSAAGHQPGIRRLREIASKTPGVRVLEEPLDYSGVLSLYASADVLVSLHRSEGLGLNMLEAMSLGVPVLATGWSGNMDFTTERTAALVQYKLVDIDVPRTSPYHRKNMGRAAQWADPDVDDAANWMRQLASDSLLRERLAASGLLAAQERQTRYLEGGVLEDLNAALGGWTPERPQQRLLRRLARGYLPDYSVRLWRGVMRRVRAMATH